MPVYNYTAIDDPSQVGFTTSAVGINNSGQFVGFYHDANGNHGFSPHAAATFLIPTPTWGETYDGWLQPQDD